MPRTTLSLLQQCHQALRSPGREAKELEKAVDAVNQRLKTVQQELEMLKRIKFLMEHSLKNHASLQRQELALINMTKQDGNNQGSIVSLLRLEKPFLHNNEPKIQAFIDWDATVGIPALLRDDINRENCNSTTQVAAEIRVRDADFILVKPFPIADIQAKLKWMGGQ